MKRNSLILTATMFLSASIAFTQGGPIPPDATTLPAQSVVQTQATFRGMVNCHGQITNIKFEYGLTSLYGLSVIEDSYMGDYDQLIISVIHDLLPNSTYHYRIVAESSAGTTFGDDMSFTTMPVGPEATTNAATDVNRTSATLNGTVNANNSSTTVSITIIRPTLYQTFIADQSPVNGLVNSPVSKRVTDLIPGTTYHYRVIAKNAGGEWYGTWVPFTTSPNAAPIISGTQAGQTVNDKQTISPFNNVTIEDADGDMVVTTVTLDNINKGKFTAASLSASGFTGPAGNVYSLASSSPANASAAIRQLVFDPSENRTAVGGTETTTFTIEVNDGYDNTQNSTTSVVSTSVNDSPSATNMNQNQNYTEGDASVALDGIVITDADPEETVTAALTLANTSTGSLSASSGQGETYSASTGVWTVTGSVSSVNTALAVVAFIPETDNDTNTQIATHIEDAAGAGPSDGVILLNVTPVNDAPIISNIANVSILSGFGTSWIAFTVDDIDNNAASLTLTGTSSNRVLVAENQIYFSGEGQNRQVQVIPCSGKTGSTLITVHVSDGEDEAVEHFHVKVTQRPSRPNQPPVFTDKLPEITIIQSDRYHQCLNEWIECVEDPDTPDSLLTFEILENGIVTHTMNEDTCIFAAPADWLGTDTLNVVVTDDGAETDTTALLVHVVFPVSQLQKNRTSDMDESANNPSQFTLAQNFPNPFNPSTTIEFSLPEKTHVTLIIYNMLGHEVARLVDEERGAGMYSVLWDASDVSAGIYFYRIQAGSQTIIRKCILTK